MKKYLNIYTHILKTSLQQVLQYRLNAFIQSLYAFFYLLMLYLSIHLMFLHTSSIAGWNKNDVLLIFSVMNLMFSFFLAVMLESIRHFMTRGVANGEADMFMTKPANTQFLISFFYPDISQILVFLGAIIYWLYMVYVHLNQISLSNLMNFIIVYLMCSLIFYFIYTLYAVSAFYITKSNQVLELANKLTDFGFYPMNMFPHSFQIISYTILPIAFFGYIPTLFLLGKGSWQLFILCIIMLLVTYILNRVGWRKGLQAYSSASS